MKLEEGEEEQCRRIPKIILSSRRERLRFSCAKMRSFTIPARCLNLLLLFPYFYGFSVMFCWKDKVFFNGFCVLDGILTRDFDGSLLVLEDICLVAQNFFFFLMGFWCWNVWLLVEYKLKSNWLFTEVFGCYIIRKENLLICLWLRL